MPHCHLVATNLRGWVPSVICNPTLPPWGEFQVVATGLVCKVSLEDSNFKWSLYYSRNHQKLTFLSFHSAFPWNLSPCSIAGGCPSHLMSLVFGEQNGWGLRHLGSPVNFKPIGLQPIQTGLVPIRDHLVLPKHWNIHTLPLNAIIQYRVAVKIEKLQISLTSLSRE